MVFGLDIVQERVEKSCSNKGTLGERLVEGLIEDAPLCLGDHTELLQKHACFGELRE